ncbi:MAG: tetratricopeptide repeat protein [Oceanicaulis sp.]
MVDVFDEVEEELRRERYQAALRRYGPWVAGAAAAIVLGAAGYQYWDWSTSQSSAEASDQYQTAAEALASGDLSAADAGFADLAEDGPRGYAALSLLRRGEIALQQGNSEEAARFYEAAAERSPEPLTRQLATYKAVLARFGELSYDDVRVRLAPLTEGDAPFGALAREMIAAAALRAERWDEARSAYERLAAVSLDAPPGVSRRATEALTYIAQNAPRAVAEDAAEAAAAAPEDGAGAAPGVIDTGEGGEPDASIQQEDGL